MCSLNGLENITSDCNDEWTDTFVETYSSHDAEMFG